MNDRHRAIRAQISVMCRKRAIDFIKAFHLAPDEEAYIIDKEVDKMQIPAIAEKHNVTVETVTRRRHDAFQKICDAMDYAKEKENQ